MKNSIGFIEFRSIAKGIEITDKMLKVSNVELVYSDSICPGKYMTIIRGHVGAIKNSMNVGKVHGESYVLFDHIIANVSEKIFPALCGVAHVNHVKSIGIIETMSAITSIIVADTAVKTAVVDLIDIRLAKALGGKGVVLFTGEISSVKAALNSCVEKLRLEGDIIATSIISAPSKSLIEKLY